MDVSNSTGQETGYRVVGAGGSTRPDPKKAKELKKLKEGDIITLNRKRLIKLKDTFWEILDEGTLEAWTYVTLDTPTQPFMVQFHCNGTSHYLCDVVRAAEERKATPGELLIALTREGDRTFEAYFCRRKQTARSGKAAIVS